MSDQPVPEQAGGLARRYPVRYVLSTMAFPIPDPVMVYSSDAQRDEEKREASPPSSFFAQSQGLLLAVQYFENLNSGYQGTAIKHMNRIRSALFAQLMANFEFSLKDFLAQTLDVTHIFDAEVSGWKWIEIDVTKVLSVREESAKIGALLIHPLLGWQEIKTLNSRYQDVFGKPIVRPNEEQTLGDLWIVRHSVAHNGGFVTRPDARRLRSAPLADRPLLIDGTYLESAIWFLRGIIERLETDMGPVLLRRWFRLASARDWSQDQEFYRPVKRLTLYVQSRNQSLPAVEKSDYDADLALYPA